MSAGAVMGGNRCGHKRNAPRLTPSKDVSERAPLIIRRLMQRIGDYYKTPDVLPTLKHSNRSMAGRIQRSEARESSLLLLATVLKFTDVASLRCGVPTRDGFAGLSFKTLANHAGMTLRRTERACAYLKRAGLLTVGQVAEKLPDGSFVGVAAVKAVSKHLWGVFGLLEMLTHERSKAAKRVRKVARSNHNIVSRARSRAALQLDALRGAAPRQFVSSPEQARAISLREIELMMSDPGASPDEIRRKARQSLKI